VRLDRSVRRLALVALLVAVAAAVRLLAVSDWDPTAFTAFGEDAVEITTYAEEKLGREVRVRAGQGHDGKFFFVQANDPLILEPEENAALLDRPAYRSQRMLYPLISGGAGLFPADWIVWTMILVNIASLVVGSLAVGAIAVKHGLSPWWGLAFVFNIGLLSEMYIGGAGALAFALACLGALALEEDRTDLAAIAFAGAALTREVMLVFIGFVALFWMARRRVAPWTLALPALGAVVAWAVYARARVPATPGIAQVREITLVPFSGLAEAATSGLGNTADYMVMVLFVFLIVLVPIRALRSKVYLTWGSVGFAVLAPFLTVVVWQKSFDISRALAPLVTVFLIEFALARKRRMERVPAVV
jgi:hypothetical protein